MIKPIYIKGGMQSMIVFVGALIFLSALVSVIWPYAGWYISIGWKFKDAEPSEAALLMQRIMGIVVMLVLLYIAFLK